ncbi:hypothetical protein A2608_02295 [Candidatus Azambacteria bacterium RIFOXYD1_FULL_44_10]|nr:MAG: hypothetical protein A2608_02295 [Candidatus Azambacteria bacterium RIFOXYD1_FULL_44_10]
MIALPQNFRFASAHIRKFYLERGFGDDLIKIICQKLNKNRHKIFKMKFFGRCRRIGKLNWPPISGD